MFESIKNKIWELLKEKEVSLAMLYNHKGEILWHRGRKISGKLVGESEGFSKSLIRKTLEQFSTIEEENVVITSQATDLSRSANVLRIKSLLIIPVPIFQEEPRRAFYLYIDSGARESFNHTDREIFKVLGSLLGEMINQVINNENDIGGICGSSNLMAGIRELVLKYSLEEEPILLLGETGVGKSHLAKLIHLYSGKKGKFITVNTPSIPENLIESEIFGHKKGAFTGATEAKNGLVQEAAGGTLFLDEIAEIPLIFQAKLLRFIESKQYQVLGDPIEKKADVRIIAATNQKLWEAINQKTFREDLYFRLQVFELEVPPLRERKEDIIELVRANRELLRGKQMGEGFLEAFEKYDWPGNIRQLITVLRRLGVHANDPISPADIDFGNRDLRSPVPIENHEPMQSDETENKDGLLFEEFWRQLHKGESFWDCVWPLYIKRDLNKSQVKQFLKEGYQSHQYSLKKLSLALNIRDIQFKRFIAAIHKYNIHPAK